MSHQFHPSILREYDIRGVVGQTLGAVDAHAIGRSFASCLRGLGGSRVVVGYDGRLSSEMLEAALVEGLNASGMDVVRIGLGPTPMLYFAEASLEQVDGGIQVTGSHNPADHNGFKFVAQGRPFFGQDLNRLGHMAAAGDWIEGQGHSERRDILTAYVDRLLQGLAGLDSRQLSRLRIGWDAGNGAAGPALERLTSKLPGEHHLLFTKVDGHFPNHHPDPTEEINLADLRALVAQKKLHFGIAFDGDGDRIGVVDGDGRIVDSDQLLMIFAEDILQRESGATIIADIKCSRALFDHVKELNGETLMWKSGHSHIKSKMKEVGALLGGEMSGHFFFDEDYYGFDDGLYAAIQLIAATMRLNRSVTELHDAMPAMFNTPELRFPVEESRKFAVVDEVCARLAMSGAEVNVIDGARVTTDAGWWLLRASNTQAMLVARAESGDQEGLNKLIAEMDAQLALSGIQRQQHTVH